MMLSISVKSLAVILVFCIAKPAVKAAYHEVMATAEGGLCVHFSECTETVPGRYTCMVCTDKAGSNITNKVD